MLFWFKSTLIGVVTPPYRSATFESFGPETFSVLDAAVKFLKFKE